MIVGVSGKAGSGKGVFAEVAQREFGAQIISFASGVKEEVIAWFEKHDIVHEYRHLYGSQADKEAILRVGHTVDLADLAGFFSRFAQYSNGHWQFTCRSFLQYWGTEYRRAQDPDYWVKLALAKVTDPTKLYVIDDVRFPNEAQAIPAAGGKLVRVERPDAPGISNMSHPSETALDEWTDWDFTIINNFTLDSYKEMCRNYIARVV